MWRVYISSTYKDLKVEREAVREALLQMHLIPAGMEAYNSSETPPLKRCQEDIATCQVYVGICAWRYGFVPPGETRCITELEYEQAGMRGIPRLLFLLGANAPWPMERADLDRAQVTAWRQRLEQRHVIRAFATPDELRANVIAALSEIIPRSDDGADDIPALLPYLPDRGPQEDAIEQALSNDASHPLVCIVHGDEYQSHDQLLKRLKEDTLPNQLQLEVAVTAPLMGWPPDFATYDELQRLLLRNLAKELSLGPQAPKEKIDAVLQALPGPALVHTYLLSRDFERHGARLLEAYLQLWQDWPELRPGRRLLAVLFVQYQLADTRDPLQRWRLWRLNRQIAGWFKSPGDTTEPVYGALDLSRFDRVMVRVLPRLKGVTETEAETWARSAQVTRVCSSAELVAEIKQFYRQYETPEIPMDTLARKLRSLLERHCRKETLA